MWIEATWAERVSATPCPCCQESGRMARHAVYRKYYYADQIEILRVRCLSCGVTHAIMPSFSLPNTSIGTEEAEEYLKARASGSSRSRAARCLLALGLSNDYPRRLERRLEVAVSRGKALWPHEGRHDLRGLAWLVDLCGGGERPLVEMNRFALAHGVNALCFCRSSILLFGRAAVRGRVSHKAGTAATPRAAIDSA
jgi:hypothetical protein